MIIKINLQSLLSTDKLKKIVKSSSEIYVSRMKEEKGKTFLTLTLWIDV